MQRKTNKDRMRKKSVPFLFKTSENGIISGIMCLFSNGFCSQTAVFIVEKAVAERSAMLAKIFGICHVRLGSTRHRIRLFTVISSTRGKQCSDLELRPTSSVFSST